MEIIKIRDLSKKLKTILKRGDEAFDRGTYEYSNAMYRRVLLSEPNCYEVRDKLRESQTKSLATKKSFMNSMMAGIVATWHMSVTMQWMFHKGRDYEALDLAEKIFSMDPSSPVAGKCICLAAEECGEPYSAKTAMEIVYSFHPKSTAVKADLAKFYGQAGEGVKCLQLYKEIAAQNPNSRKWQELLRDANALASMDRGGWTKAAKEGGDFRDLIKDKEQTALLEQQGRTALTEEGRQLLIDELLNEIEEQDSIDRRTKLSELYFESENFDEARIHAEKSIELSNVRDPNNIRLLRNIDIGELKHKIESLEREGVPIAEIQAVENQITDILLSTGEEILTKFPNTHDERFDYANLLFKLDRYDEALAHLQKLSQNPRYRIDAAQLIGNCFVIKELWELAEEQFQIVINESPTMTGIKKNALYEMGLIYENLKRWDDSHASFKEIYQVDIGYRDVKERIENSHRS